MVYLVGAGPGDEDLMTRKGLKLLREADVVVYDNLASSSLLNEVRDDAETYLRRKAFFKSSFKTV